MKSAIKRGMILWFAVVGHSGLAAASEFNSATYDSIAAQAKQADAAPVNVTSNFFLGWTGAWDTLILKEAKLWEKWLPKGSAVEWKRNLQGPPVVTDMLAGKQQIGYLGDNPAIVATTKRSLASISIVGANLISHGRMCGTFVFRSDAPDFKDFKEAAQWLRGKKVGVPKGSCADRLGRLMLSKEGVDVTWQQMQGEVIVTSLQAKKIDAGVMYEPHLSKTVFDGHAKYAWSPGIYGEVDADLVFMRNDFIDQNRAAAVAWMKANIEALYFLRDKPIETVEFVKKELPDYTRENIWYALYGSLPDGIGAAGPVLIGALTVTPEARALIERGHKFLVESKIVKDPELPADAVRTDIVEQAFNELGLDPTKALFDIPAGGVNPYKGDELVGAGK